MKKIILFFLNAIIISLLFTVTTVFGASDYQVYLNGQALSFKTTQPINVEGRVMVPIREIGEQLGMSITYDEPTQVMVFSKPGYTISHRMLTNSITVNGAQQLFDVPSINRDNWTLMPVRMLAEAVDAEVSYVPSGNGGIVYINSISTPAVNSITFSSNTVKSNDNVTITVLANNQTNRMKLFLANGNMLSETSAYTTTSDGSRKFVFTHSPSVNETNFSTYKAVPGNDTAFYDDSDYSKTGSIVVQALPAPVINSITVKRSTITVNDTVTFTVTANQYTEKVRLTNDFNDTVAESSTFETSGDVRTFSVNMKASKDGSRVFTVDAANTHGYVAASSKDYTVTVMSSSAVSGLQIVSVSASPKSVLPGNYTTITVVTNKTVNKVSVLDSSNYSVAYTTSYVSQNDYNATRTWELKVRMSSVGIFNYYVVAHEGANTVDQRVQLECSKDASSQELTIWSVTSSYTTVKVDSTTMLVVLTTTDVDYVELLDSSGTYIDAIYSYYTIDTVKNEKKWIFDSVAIKKTGTNTFTVKAYGIFGNYITETVNVTGSNSTTSGSYGYSIISAVPSSNDYYQLYDTVYVTVRTEKDVSNVEIFNSSGKSMAYLSSYSYTSGNYLVWELQHYASSSGKTYYTVEARDYYSSYSDTLDYYIYVY